MKDVKLRSIIFLAAAFLLLSCSGLKQVSNLETDSKCTANDGKTTIDTMYFYKYQENNDEITITEYIGEEKNIRIPVHINGKQVRVIGNYTFSSCSEIESIFIPTTVAIIGESSFAYCSALKSMDIPQSVTSIGDYAFHECSGLSSIIIPKNVVTIGNYAFKGCPSLTISGYKNSSAEKFAADNNIPFKSMD